MYLIHNQEIIGLKQNYKNNTEGIYMSHQSEDLIGPLAAAGGGRSSGLPNPLGARHCR